MPLARAELEALLRTRQLDGTLTTSLPDWGTGPARDSARDLSPVGAAALDARLGGGLPRGQISELVGPRSSGRTSLLLGMLAAATARGELVALVDALDMLDVASAAAAGVDLDRLLWVRGHVVPNPGMCRDMNQRALEQAIRAFTLVLQAGTFGLVAFDVAEAPADAVRRLPFTTWLRLQRMVEGTQTTCVLVGSESMARSSAGLTLRVGIRDSGFGGDSGFVVVRDYSRDSMSTRASSARARDSRTTRASPCRRARCTMSNANPETGTNPKPGANPEPRIPNPLYACLYRPPAPDAYDDQRRDRGTRREDPGGQHSAGSAGSALNVVEIIAREFSPRYERHRDDLVSVDVSGLDRLLGSPRAIGEELRREAASRGVRLHVAIAGTRTAALVLAQARPGLTIVERGEEANALAPIPIAILEKIDEGGPAGRGGSRTAPTVSTDSAIAAFKHWGIKTLGEVAALPAADLVSRFGPAGRVWPAMARGDDLRPLMPTLEDERFESSLELEWPIEGLEPLSFVLTRLLEPLSTRLERRDRGAAVLHVMLRLVTRDEHTRRLELPSPMRDVRTLRTLALLDLDAHPPPAAIDRVAIVIDPTPGRVLQHTLFTRAHPTPEQLSTLVARLNALMGQDRLGAPVVVDSYRPGAFAMKAFATDVERKDRKDRKEEISRTARESRIPNPESRLVSALRRCRHPVPARVTVDQQRPVRVTTDRRGFAGGTVVACAGPWRTSGDWWAGGAGRAGQAGRVGGAGQAGRVGGAREEKPQERSVPPVQPVPPIQPSAWNRDEWDVSLSDGAVYRIFQDRISHAWFIDAIAD